MGRPEACTARGRRGSFIVVDFHHLLLAGFYRRTGLQECRNSAFDQKSPGFLRGYGQEWSTSAVLIIYPVDARTRKTVGSMTRKLSVTESLNSGQHSETFSRRNSSSASANSLYVA
jgi:hypothetical protein